MIPSHRLSLAGASILLVVALCACSRAPETGAADESGAQPAARPEAPATAPGQGAMTETAPATQTPAPGQTAEGAAGETVKRPGTVSPAPGVEPSKVKNWMLIEFARPLEDADLAWLKQNGFQVDTVMSPTMVRGWLERAEGGEVIGTDPRIARVHAQMR